MKVAVYERVEDLPGPFLEIMALQQHENLFLTPEWFSCLLQHGMPQTMTPRIFTVSRDTGAPSLVMLFGHYGSKRSLLGLSNFYTMEYQPIFAPEETAYLEPLEALARHIASERPRWDTVVIRNLRRDHPANPALLDAFRRSGFVLEEYFQFHNWNTSTDGMTFEEYYAARPSKLKNTIKRREKAARRDHDLDFILYTGQENLDRGIADYVQIYETSWKSAEQYPDFMANLIETCAQMKVLRLGVLYIDSVPAAAQIWITTAKGAVIYKLAYNEEFSKMSAGTILSKYMVQQALDRDKVPEIDYGIGNEPYKKDWMTDWREIFGVEAYNTGTVVGRLSAIACQAKSKLRKLRVAMPTRRADVASEIRDPGRAVRLACTAQ